MTPIRRSAGVLLGLLCGALSGCALVDAGIDGPVNNDAMPPCQGLSCQVDRCPAGQETRIRGVVTVPNGRDPLRQAVVYVPQSGALTPISPELRCELCSDPIAGRAVTFAYSGADGRFELRGVPSGNTVPIVVQKGRFRRLFQARVSPCAVNELPADAAHLSRSQAEGELPKMAVAAGDHDAIECVLSHVGVSLSEFTTPERGGAVHLYDNQKPGTPTLPGQLSIASLLRERARLLRYQLVFLNCSGIAYSEGLLKEPAVRANLIEFLSRGGRLYATDWSYDFLAQLPELAPFVCFEDDADCAVTAPHGFHSAVARGGTGDPLLAAVTPAGAGLRDFLLHLPAPPAPIDPARIPITELLPGWVQVRSTAVDQARFPSTTWLTAESTGRLRPLTISFDYPPRAGCGRALFSSYHTRERASDKAFPAYCPLSSALPQEYVLEYLLFDLSDCVGPIN